MLTIRQWHVLVDQRIAIFAFDCIFCYTPGTSCQNINPSDCFSISGSSAVTLPSLTEVTYCYRVTARANGNLVAVVQGTFSTGEGTLVVKCTV